MSERVAIVVLAAGRGVRFGGDVPKPLLVFAGQPLLAHALRAATGAGSHDVVCVVSDDRVAGHVPANVEIVRNDDPERGIASSLQAALQVLESRTEIDAVVVGLADQPLVGSGAYARLAAVDAPLAVATYGGIRGNPVRIARGHWAEALELGGDEGARVLLRRHDAHEVPCDGTGSPADIDTPDDLHALEQQWRSQTASE